MADFATLDDVERNYRPLIANEPTVAQTWLGVASAQLRVRIADVDVRLADPNYEALVRGVVAGAVVRALRGQSRQDTADYGSGLVWESEIKQLLSAGTDESSSLPVGSFPDAYAWPDPVQC